MTSAHDPVAVNFQGEDEGSETRTDLLNYAQHRPGGQALETLIVCIIQGKQIGDHLRSVGAALPPGVKQIYGRADSGFYCREASRDMNNSMPDS